MHPVALLPQVVHQLARTVHQSGLRRAEVQEYVAGLQAVRLRRLQPPAKAQRTAEALHDEVVARDFALRVARPQVDVRPPVFIIEQLRVSEVLPQLQRLEQLAQRYHGIAMRVVQRVVEVDK